MQAWVGQILGFVPHLLKLDDEPAAPEHQRCGDEECTEGILPSVLNISSFCSELNFILKAVSKL